MFKREFCSSSDDSFSDEGPGTPPPEFNRVIQDPYQADFDIQPHPKTQFSTNPSSGPSPFIQQMFQPTHPQQPKPFVAPLVKSQNEKVGFFEPSSEFSFQKPELSSESPQIQPPVQSQAQTRPQSASSQMRAKMIQQERAKYQNKFGAANIGVSSNTGMISSNPGMLSGNPPMMLGSFNNNFSNLYTGPSFTNQKLGPFNPTGVNFQAQPFRKSENEELPAPIKPDRKVIQDDQLETEVISEESSVRKNPSYTLNSYHQQKEVQGPIQQKTNIQVVVQEPDNRSFVQPVREPVQFSEPKQAQWNMNPPNEIPAQIQQPRETAAPIQQPREIAAPIQPPQPAPTRLPPSYQEQTPKMPEQVNQPIKPAQPVQEAPQPVGPTPQTEETKQQFRQPRSQPQQEQKRPDRAAIARNNLNIKEIIDRQLLDKKKFLTSPLPRGVMLQCTIKRQKSGFSRLWPKYFMHISNGWTFLMGGKKRPGNKTSNYMITMNQSQFSTKSQDYLGKVRSNFLGTQFHSYDGGLNPKNRGATPVNSREEISVVLYQSNILGTKGPRKMRVLIPSVNASNDHYVWKPKKKDEGMMTNYKNGNTNGMLCFYNKPPKWNEHVQAFVLNFNGRVDRASVKNFQLIDDRDENKVYLQFGRVGDHHFNIDFQWPFSPLQAFSVALGSFDYKFACE